VAEPLTGHVIAEFGLMTPLRRLSVRARRAWRTLDGNLLGRRALGKVFSSN
jgi:hypothetical protein